MTTEKARSAHGRAASAYYWASVREFLDSSADSIVGRLATADAHSSLEADQLRAWSEEIHVLREALAGLGGTIYLEFDVPRLGSRIDAVLISGPAVFPIEFKCGEHRFTTDALNQAWDYGLDLKNFHLASHQAPIFPVLVATRAPSRSELWADSHPDGVRRPRCVAGAELGRAIREGVAQLDSPAIDGVEWGRSPYQPTPTIIEAARALYSRHSVEAITRNDAGATNLRITSTAVEEIIERVRARREKALVFLTGVPGAGKTLVGLNVATRRRELGEARAVFLSGNQPLVSVLQEALTRDELRRQGGGVRKGVVRQQVKPFIQNIHHFRDEGIRNPAAPDEHVFIFDEAQRAWDRRKTADFMKRRKKIADFDRSESEFLISCVDRHDEWAVIVCLVGGGQEIHDGEAGIAAWLEAIQAFPRWRTFISPSLTDTEYAAGHALESLTSSEHSTLDDRLHLATSMRSFRSEKVSAFVKALLDCDDVGARAAYEVVSKRYPIVMTRDLGARQAVDSGKREGFRTVRSRRLVTSPTIETTRHRCARRRGSHSLVPWNEVRHPLELLLGGCCD